MNYIVQHFYPVFDKSVFLRKSIREFNTWSQQFLGGTPRICNYVFVWVVLPYFPYDMRSLQYGIEVLSDPLEVNHDNLKIGQEIKGGKVLISCNVKIVIHQVLERREVLIINNQYA